MPTNNNHKATNEEFKRKFSIFEAALYTEDACLFINW